MPACVDPVTEHTTTVSKKTPTRVPARRPRTPTGAKPRPPSGWSEAPAGMAYGFPPAASTSRSARSQLSLNPIPNPAGTAALGPGEPA